MVHAEAGLAMRWSIVRARARARGNRPRRPRLTPVMVDPYRKSEAPNRTTQVFEGLNRDFRSLCDQQPRGVWARMGDQGLQSRLILGAVASVIAPMLTEVERLRREVKTLRAALLASTPEGP